eukprot:SAG25_NODE_14469_length_254_cov_1.335484_1_plen_41_part_01
MNIEGGNAPAGGLALISLLALLGAGTASNARFLGLSLRRLP